MLASLIIKNFAIIKDLKIDLFEGLNVFTGETGAGKSIILKAIDFVVGARGSKDMIRFGEKCASVEAMFEKLSDEILKIIECDLEIEVINREILIERKIFSDGRTNSLINGKNIGVRDLKKIGDKLVHFSEQGSNQKLLVAENNLKMLDDFAENDELIFAYRQSFEKLSKIFKSLKQIDYQIELNNKKFEQLSEQISEIEKINLKPEEDEQIEGKLKLIKNSAEIFEVLNLICEKFSGCSGNYENVLNIFSESVKNLERIVKYDLEFKTIFEKFKSLFFETQELIIDIENLKNVRFDFEPNRVEILENRLSDISKIKRKFGPSLVDVKNNLQNFKEEIKQIQNYGLKKEELLKIKETELIKFKQLLIEISKRRKEAAAKFSAAVENELKFLEMNDANFVVKLKKHGANFNGSEDAEFFISANLGEPAKPVCKIASGGELSRIMLAIVDVMASKFRPLTLIFDEIDSGVSGLSAKKIGIKLKKLSKHTQIICITHLAQIAAVADYNFKIVKQNYGDRVFSSVCHLNFDEKIEEIARIVGVDGNKELALNIVNEMLRKNEQ